MLQSGEKYETYHGPERTCLCSRYHAIYGRDTTDQNEHVCAVYIIQFTVVIPRTRTNMFVQYIACNHKMLQESMKSSAFVSVPWMHSAETNRSLQKNLKYTVLCLTIVSGRILFVLGAMRNQCTYTQLITDTHASQEETRRDTTDHI